MRRRPKLNGAIQKCSPRPITEDMAHELVEALAEYGYDIIERRTRRRERNEWWYRMAEFMAAKRDEESVRGWALGLCDDIRHLQVRCSWLYHVAVEHGATEDELRHHPEPV